MKLKIDTTNKTVIIEESVKITELNNELIKLLGVEYLEYEIISNEKIAPNVKSFTWPQMFESRNGSIQPSTTGNPNPYTFVMTT